MSRKAVNKPPRKYYVRTYRGGKLVREHFATFKEKRAEAFQKMFPASVIETAYLKRDGSYA